MLYVANAFSFNMFNFVPEVLTQSELNEFEARELLMGGNFISVVGHADTAAVLSKVLHHEVKFNRASTKFEYGDHILVCQYIGPRLEEGATELPEGATIKFILVRPRKKEDIGCYHCGPSCVQW